MSNSGETTSEGAQLREPLSENKSRLTFIPSLFFTCPSHLLQRTVFALVRLFRQCILVF